MGQRRNYSKVLKLRTDQRSGFDYRTTGSALLLFQEQKWLVDHFVRNLRVETGPWPRPGMSKYTRCFDWWVYLTHIFFPDNLA